MYIVSGLLANEFVVNTNTPDGQLVNTINSNGRWTISNLEFTDIYTILIGSQPPGQSCTPSPSSGVMGATDAEIPIVCTVCNKSVL